MYAIVEFNDAKLIETKECEVVPMKWIISEANCFWPPTRSLNMFKKLVKENADPQHNWTQYNIRILHKFATYEKALQKLPQAMVESNLETEDDTESVPSVNSQDQGPLSYDNLENTLETNNIDIIDANAISSINFCECHKAFQTYVTTTLEKICEENRTTKLLLNELIQIIHKGFELPLIDEPKNLPKLPMTSYDEFQTFENFLLEEKNYLFMIQKCSVIGGATAEDKTRKIMKTLLLNEVGVLFNWKGRDKKAFEITKTKQLIFDAVLKNFPRSTDLEISGAIKDWLKYSNARLQYQKNKKKN